MAAAVGWEEGEAEEHSSKSALIRDTRLVGTRREKLLGKYTSPRAADSATESAVGECEAQPPEQKAAVTCPRASPQRPLPATAKLPSLPEGFLLLPKTGHQSHVCSLPMLLLEMG